MLRFLLVFVAVIALFSIALTVAHASGPDIRLEAGLGMCKAKQPPENLWHQNDRDNHLQMWDRCSEFGVSLSTPIRDLWFVTRYANLGRFATHAQAIADDNDDFTRRGLVSQDFRRAECAQGFHADCLYNWNGMGDAKGFLFGAAYEPFKVGPVRLGLEAGLFVYRATWREIVSPLDCPANQCWQLQIDQRTGWQRSPETALTARLGYLYAAARRYDVPTHAPITPGFKAPIYQFILGVSVPL